VTRSEYDTYNMFYDSSRDPSPSTSQSSSMASQAISIGSTQSNTGSISSTHRASVSSTRYSTCACPSWPSGSGLKKTGSGVPSAYISDEDLFGDDDEHYLSEPPPPPRPAQMWAPVMAQPLLPSVTKTRRTSGDHKKSRKGSKSSGSIKG